MNQLPDQVPTIAIAACFAEGETIIKNALTARWKECDRIAAVCTELKKMGLQFAIDDFGVGYSSFNYLRQLPIDTIKIDRSFLNDITTNPDDAAIVSAIIAMSHGLNLEVIAEGVETEEHRKFLWEQGCDMFQGFLLSKPMSAGDVEIFLKDHQIAPKNPSS